MNECKKLGWNNSQDFEKRLILEIIGHQEFLENEFIGIIEVREF